MLLDAMIMGDTNETGPHVQRFGTMAGRGHPDDHLPQPVADRGRMVPRISEHCQPRESQPFTKRGTHGLGICGPISTEGGQAIEDQKLHDWDPGRPTKCMKPKSFGPSPEEEGNDYAVSE